MKRQVVPVALRFALPIALLGTMPARAATSISSCPYTITAPGAYVVAKDLTCSGTAITITASNVALHLGGHTLSGDGFSGEGIDVEGPAGNSVSIDHGAVRGFQDGIYLNNALNCQISSVTASQNSRAGMLILFSAANTVTDSTASQNGDKGIELYGSHGNTLMRNAADQNSNLGISFETGSYGNTAVHNTATANRGTGGIVLAGGTTQNTVQNNTCSGNFIGIELGVYGFGAAIRNTIQNNTANLNGIGIQVIQASSDNTLQGNTALTNSSFDVEDDNPGCDSNHWLNNRFVTFQVAGGPDGGCLLGQPNTAQLSVTGGGPAINLAPGSCLTLALKVRFAGRSDYLDVSTWSETSFSAPGHGTVSGNQLCVGPSDANTTFTVYGRYTDPVSGVSTTGTISVHVHR